MADRQTKYWFGNEGTPRYVSEADKLAWRLEGRPVPIEGDLYGDSGELFMFENGRWIKVCWAK